MQSHRTTVVCLLVFGPLFCGLGISMAQKPAAKPVSRASDAAKPVDFAHDVLPALKASCFQCHGAEKQAAGLRMDSRAFLLKGGVSGTALLPGQGKASLIVQRALGMGGKPRMPLGFAPLSPAQMAKLTAWIDQGAVWPESVNAKHWAYVRPVLPKTLVVKNKTWVRSPIDAFVLARLEKAGLTPSPEAPKETLLRRVSLDLTGLPPSPKEIDAFLADKSPDAYAKVVDRLLASPQYGERWARLWLDLARYADTNGYEKDGRRSIWPYRDWVIDAFNRDMPFDTFTIEQIAGDMLPNATPAQKIASGFHRNTMLNEEGGVDRAEQRWLTVVDRVSTTAQIWLGTTLQCAQCHNHKYDPFTMKEYYQFFAFFDHCDEPALKVITPIQEAQKKTLQTELDALNAERTNLQNAGRPPADRIEALDKQIADMKKQIDGILPAETLVFQEKSDNLVPATFTHIKGGFLAKDEEVKAAVPAVLNPLPAGQPVNRLGLARWLVDRDNPLTARVAVNRIWEQLFGRGLVETTEDFGTQGQKPTHPELLDWLAVRFETPADASSPADCGWSQKRLLRLIVLSATYRQASKVSPALQERDPTNRLLARGPRFRMEAEMLRDSALSCAGLLSLKVGGPSVFPFQPEGIWVMPYNGDTWKLSDGDDHYRRGLYTFWRRTSPYPSFLSFDASSREYCTVRRIRTTTPLQALTTLNDPAFFDAARGLARRMKAEGGAAISDRFSFGFRACVARRPKPDEMRRLSALYTKELTRYQANAKAALSIAGGKTAQPDTAEIAALTIVANVLLNLDETLTKE
jgi:mono/diheme cytochrome c family protein